MAERQNMWSGWQDRISALRNVPAVLNIVWDSGPAVVVFGLVSRLFSSVLPVVLLWITKLIIDGIVHAVSTHQAVQPGCGAESFDHRLKQRGWNGEVVRRAPSLIQRRLYRLEGLRIVIIPTHVLE